MSDRPSKRLRRASTEDGDSEGTDDWLPQAMNSIGGARSTSSQQRQASSSTSSSRRAAAQDMSKKSIRLTVKAPPSRLREITGDSDDDEEPATTKTRETLGRGSKNKKPIIDPPSDEDEEDEEEDEEEEEEVEEDGDEEEDEELSGEEEEDDEDAEEDSDDEADDDAEDSELPDATPQPSRPSIKITAPRKGSPGQRLKQAGSKIQSVEDKEMMSSLSQEEEDEEMEEDGEGDMDEEMEDEQGDKGDTITASAIHDSDLDSDDSSLPDLSKLTRRQRATDAEDLMALSNEAQKKKFFTAEQISMRRAEMARRRKDLSEKRNEEEKADTLKRLLHKPAPKRRSKAQMLADAEREEFGLGRASEEVEGRQQRAPKGFVKTIIGREETRVCVPDEWLGAPIGQVYEASGEKENWSKVVRDGRMVQEVE